MLDVGEVKLAGLGCGSGIGVSRPHAGRSGTFSLATPRSVRSDPVGGLSSSGAQR